MAALCTASLKHLSQGSCVSVANCAGLLSFLQPKALHVVCIKEAQLEKINTEAPWP